MNKSKWRRITKLPKRCKLIRKVRNKLGYSQMYVALEIEMSLSRYQKVEANFCDLNDKEAESLAKVLGLNVKLNEI